MKRIFVLSVLMLFFELGMNAQENKSYRPFIKEGKVWNFRHRHLWNTQGGPKYLYYSYVMQGDTTINGLEYKKLYMRHSRYNCYTAALREEGCRAFIVPVDSVKEYVFYDLEPTGDVQMAFGLKAQRHGNTTMTASSGETLVVAIYTIPPFRALFKWIECIGSDQDMFKCQLFGPQDGTQTIGGYGELVSCYDEDGYIYGDESSVPDTERMPIQLTYEAKEGLQHSPSEIWAVEEEGFYTFYLRNVSDHFRFCINGEPALALDLTGTMFTTEPTPDARYMASLPKGTTIRYSIESDYESFSFDIVTAIHDIATPETVNSKSLNGKCYDLSGRQIGNGQWTMDNVPRGVYVRDGKKVAARRSR